MQDTEKLYDERFSELNRRVGNVEATVRQHSDQIGQILIREGKMEAYVEQILKGQERMEGMYKDTVESLIDQLKYAHEKDFEERKMDSDERKDSKAKRLEGFKYFIGALGGSGITAVVQYIFNK